MVKAAVVQMAAAVAAATQAVLAAAVAAVAAYNENEGGSIPTLCTYIQGGSSYDCKTTSN